MPPLLDEELLDDELLLLDDDASDVGAASFGGLPASLELVDVLLGADDGGSFVELSVAGSVGLWSSAGISSAGEVAQATTSAITETAKADASGA